MANVKISALPTATTIGTGDLIPIVQGGVTKQATADSFPFGAVQAAAVAARYVRADVIAPAATGTAATDTANLLAAIAATPVGGRLYLPSASQYVVNQAIVITKSMTVEGQSLLDNLTGANLDLPQSPYLLGTVIKQTAAATNGITVDGVGINVNLANIGVIFDAAIAGNTGHGFATIPGSSTSVGIMGFQWRNLAVYGHDGNHYGFYWHNPIHGTTDRLRSFGGGGFYTSCDLPTGNLGNLVHIHPNVHVTNAGTAHGYAHFSSTSGGDGGYLNLITYIRPQCNVYTAGDSGTATWKDDLGPAAPGTILVLNPDMENAPGSPNIVVQGAGTLFIGGQSNRGDVYNVAYPAGALANPTGGNNTAFGHLALAADTTGGSNTAVGFQALAADTVGYANTAVGRGALAAITTNTDSTAIGFQAATTGTGTQNTAVGSQTVVGDNAQTVVGYQATAASGAYHATVVGLQATASGPFATVYGRTTSATAAGSGAFGTDSTGAGAASTNQDELGVGTALHRVKVAGRLNVARRTPSGTADAQGTTGDITSDDSYVYVKTSTGWKRSALTTF